MIAGIQNQEALTSIFGYWPSFHDAELLAVRLDSDPKCFGSLETDLHVFEMTSEVDDRGFFVLAHHQLVCLRFCGLTDLELVDFQRGNILDSLEIEAIEVTDNQRCSFDIAFNAILGCALYFKCQEVAVFSVKPYEKP